MAEAFGPYLVYEQIGLGGMASVHRAESRGIAGFSRAVALKRMLPHVAADEDLVRSFVREARLASHLRHANVAQTLDLGKVGDTYFIAMELVPGKNLREVMSQCLRVCGAMPLPIALNIIGQIADALDYAHNLCDETGTPLGIIHRDVSPANVIVSEGGVAKLIDFGIAKASAQSMQTMSRTIKGKFSYMAPEYLEGRIDPRADLFALGVIAHELLANKPLFQGTDEMDTLHRIRNLHVEPPSYWSKNVPPEIDSIVMTALARDPDIRWQGAHALRAALTTEAQQLGLVAHGAQVDEWMTWAFQQKAGDFRVDTMPEISISDSNPTDEHTREVATSVTVHARPSAHPRTVARQSSPPDNVPRDEFLEEQATTLHRPSPMPIAKRSTNEIVAQLPLSPPNALTPSPPPAPIIPSGARTAPRIAVDAPIDDVLADLDAVSSVHRPEPASVAMPQPAKTTRRRWGVLLAILVVVIAAGVAAVVYFALPYLT